MNYFHRFFRSNCSSNTITDRMTPPRHVVPGSRSPLRMQRPTNKNSLLSPAHEKANKSVNFSKAALASFNPHSIPVQQIFPLQPIDTVLIDNIPRDFYIHPLDWSHSDNIFLATKNSIIFVSSKHHTVHSLKSNPDKIISLCSYENGHKIMAGSNYGRISQIDTETDKIIGFKDTERPGTVCIDINDSTCISSYSDGSITFFDFRVSNNEFNFFRAHQNVIVSTVIFSPDPNYFATGGNDNISKIWDFRNISQPVSIFDKHSACVRAISWGIERKIITGGGNGDGSIFIWDSQTGEIEKQTKHKSQICNIFWNHNTRQIITTDGYYSNSITFWDESLSKPLSSINNLKERVLYASMSPDKNNLATITPSDSLQIWIINSSKDSYNLR